MSHNECPKCEANISEPTLECPECGEKFSEAIGGSGPPDRVVIKVPEPVVMVSRKVVKSLVALDEKYFPRKESAEKNQEGAPDGSATRNLETVGWPTLIMALLAGIAPLVYFCGADLTMGFEGFFRVLSAAVLGCFVAAASSHFRGPLLSWSSRRWWHVALFAEAIWLLLLGLQDEGEWLVVFLLPFLALASDHQTVHDLVAPKWAKVRAWVSQRQRTSSEEPGKPTATSKIKKRLAFAVVGLLLSAWALSNTPFFEGNSNGAKGQNRQQETSAKGEQVAERFLRQFKADFCKYDANAISLAQAGIEWSMAQNPRSGAYGTTVSMRDALSWGRTWLSPSDYSALDSYANKSATLWLNNYDLEVIQ